MRRMTCAVLTGAAVLFTCLLATSTAAAQAPAATIDAIDTGGPQFQPPNVTIRTGETVRWEFDQAGASHTLTSSSANWTIDETRAPGGAAIERQFDAPGLYTFLCRFHAGMTGSVTVEDEAPADALENVLVFSKTAGFRHPSIPNGIAAIEQLGAANDFNVDATEDGGAFTDANLAQYDAVVWLSTTGDVLTETQQRAFERYVQSGGGYVGIHAAADTEYDWAWYGELLGGAYFNSHPEIQQATIDVEDRDEPSTQHLDARWTRTDEWYNYRANPREVGVNVLATLDESTYNPGGGAMGDDHPIAWCTDFDGGRAWYTGGGHTEASYTEAAFMQHVLGGIRTAARDVPADCGEQRQSTPREFEKVTLDDDTENPMELDVAPDGRVFYIERTGEVNIWKPDTRSTVVAGNIPVYLGEENGLIGLQLAPDFETSGWVYLAYSMLPEETNTQVVARYKVVGDQLDMSSRQEVFSWTHQRERCCHSSGSLYFGPNGDLYISTGDNTDPFESDGFAPIDERPGREAFDAQRTSANTNDLNGKILRIRPNPDTAGYTVPEGNLFAPGTPNTRPEIFAMGFRNPFRFTVDPATSWVLMADYGPDSRVTNSPRGPEGSVEYNAVTSPGNYGWPYCIRANTPYADYNFATGAIGPNFNCDAPVNESPNNTGQTQLPAARPATMWMAYTQTDSRFPELGTGGAAMSGPRYHFDPDNPSETKFPEAYDGEWFIYEWGENWIKTATLDAQGNATDVDPFGTGYLRPMDMDFGPDGSLYLIEWGTGFGGNNADSGVYRIDYVAGERAPIARATATPDNGSAPLEVQFSSEGSTDPEGTPLTYAWDFDGDGDTDSDLANPTHTYTQAGAYNARLTVTDASGKTAVDNVLVVVGNNRPEVRIDIPEEGTFVDFGDTVPYEITVTDQEDTTIDCNNVVLQTYLGHDTHAHPLRQHTGCEGTFQTLSASGHGPNENVFPLIEATYTDAGLPGGGGRLTGLDQHQLQPKRKQAEFFTATGRTADGRGTGTPGVQTEQTTDSGGGSNIGFIEDGDYVSFEPMNFKNINALVFRVASGGAGGTIEVRLGSPTGQLVATSPTIANTGGWQNWQDVSVPITDPGGTHEVFFVFRHPTNTGGLMNLNWIEAEGRGAATNARPKVSVAAEPDNGPAPLTVQFDGTGRDTDAAPGDELEYAWDFGVEGTDTDTSTEEDPTFVYTEPGTYTATLTVTDAMGASASDSIEIRVRPSSQCPQNNLRSDEFEGNALDTDRWTVIRPDSTRPPTVSDGQLHFPIDHGSIYGSGTPTTLARNIVVQPLPEGDVAVTAKITVDGLTQDYHQAGLRVYADDNNWASVHMIHAGGQRDFEFIWESNGNARNEGADKLGGIPADAPLTYWVRLVSDGTQLTAFYSYDGETFNPVGRPGSLATFNNPQIGPVALSDQAPTFPVAHFDWIRFDPDEPAGGGGPGGGTTVVDNFDGTDLQSPPWEVVRRNQELQVGGGALRIPAAQGDLYGNNDTASNLALRAAPAGAWTATAKINFAGITQYQQAGIIVYGDDANYTKLGRIAHTTAGDEKFEFIHENAGTPRNDAADSTPTVPADFPDDFYVRLTSDGTNVTGAYSTDGSSWTPVGRPAPLPANARVGLFAFGSTVATSAPVAAFDSFALTTGSGGPSGPSLDDQFDGSSLDKDRWNAIVRENPQTYSVSGGELTITTEPGDIYTANDSNPLPRNFILQSADHAGEDWVIETKLSGTINGGYGQGGLIAYADDDNYVKLDPISDAGNTRINRIELRSEVNGTPVGPTGQDDPEVPAGTTDIWVRLTKSGTTYSGEFSLNGTTWTPMGSVTNGMADPDFGLYAFGPQADGVGDTVSFDYFLLDGADTDPCACVPGPGDEFDGSSLDKTKWNAIVREDENLYDVSGGALRVTTVAGDIYTNGNPAPTRNFILQDAPEGDWVIETKVSGNISGGYEQGGLLVYVNDDNYIKYDLISDDGQTVKNRIELRSEVNGAIVTPTPEVTGLNVDAAWLRLTKTGNSYAGEYSLDGETWQSIGQPVTNNLASPKFGLFTLGVNSPGATVVFDYFSVDGSTGCPPTEPQNRAPVINSVDASPSIGFGPLTANFTVDATDADQDELTYSWDFDGDGTEDSTERSPSHTYSEPGVYEAEVTVSDGEAERSETVEVQVLEPDAADARFRVLVFSKTTGFRHASIEDGHAAIEALGTEHEFQVDHTEDATAFRDSILSRYDAVVFLSTTGDPLNETQQRAFERFIQSNKGFAGIHAAADTEYDWNWYGHLVGAYFHSHPPGTPTAAIDVEDTGDHSMRGIPARWERTDEWYNYKSPDFQDPAVGGGDYSPRGDVHVLASLDESTYDEQDGNTTDDDHPIAWCQRYDGGRSWYTGGGHTEESFSEPHFVRHILGGIEVAAGAAGSDECGVPEPGNGAPTVEAAADPRSGQAPLTVAFSAVGRDPDGDALTYRWDFGDGGTSLRQDPDHTYMEPGTYTATVTVRDPDGATGTASVEIVVNNPPGNNPPTVEAAGEPGAGKPPLTVQFSSLGTDPDGDPLTYRWDFGDGGRSFLQNPSHTYQTAGTFTATVTVTDPRGATGTAEVVVVVGNRAPTVVLAAAPQSGTAPLLVEFTANGSDPDGDALRYRFDFGDGDRTTNTSGRTTHRYRRAGVYRAKVTATDTDGATATAELDITVTPRNRSRDSDSD